VRGERKRKYTFYMCYQTCCLIREAAIAQLLCGKKRKEREREREREKERRGAHRERWRAESLSHAKWDPNHTNCGDEKAGSPGEINSNQMVARSTWMQ
jgi:hypothetical protein